MFSRRRSSTSRPGGTPRAGPGSGPLAIFTCSPSSQLKRKFGEETNLLDRSFQFENKRRGGGRRVKLRRILAGGRRVVGWERAELQRGGVSWSVGLTLCVAPPAPLRGALEPPPAAPPAPRGRARLPWWREVQLTSHSLISSIISSLF